MHVKFAMHFESVNKVLWLVDCHRQKKSHVYRTHADDTQFKLSQHHPSMTVEERNKNGTADEGNYNQHAI